MIDILYIFVYYSLLVDGANFSRKQNGVNYHLKKLKLVIQSTYIHLVTTERCKLYGLLVVKITITQNYGIVH